MSKSIHHVVQHRSGLAGVEAMTMLTQHAFPRHSHDQYGIGVMTAGAQRSWSGLGEVESSTGDVIMVNPGEMHDGAPMGSARGWHIIYLDPALLTREIGDEVLNGDFIIRPVAQDPRLRRNILRFFAEIGAPAGDPTAREEALLCCFMQVASRHRVDGPRTPETVPRAASAIQRLEDAPDQPASLAELAALCGMSRFQLLRDFFRETGATPHAYLVQLRVRMARRYLAGGKSPAEAAQLAGFADQSHLTRAFQRQFGITPGRYQAAIA